MPQFALNLPLLTAPQPQKEPSNHSTALPLPAHTQPYPHGKSSSLRCCWSTHKIEAHIFYERFPHLSKSAPDGSYPSFLLASHPHKPKSGDCPCSTNLCPQYSQSPEALCPPVPCLEKSLPAASNACPCLPRSHPAGSPSMQALSSLLAKPFP